MAWRRRKPETEGQAAAPTARETTALDDRESRAMQKVINLGKTIQIKGDLIGNEDLTIEGKLEGRIFLKDHNLTIGENGNIKADVQAKGVVVIGKLVGNITAQDKVELAATGSMRGDISAPRVMIVDGAQFRGSIDMKPQSTARVDPASPSPATVGEGQRQVVPPVRHLEQR